MNQYIEREEVTSHYVYRHLREDDGQPFYIGIGKKRKKYRSMTEEYERAYQGTNSGTARRSEFWCRTARKHGVVVEILMDELTHEEAKIKEIEVIKLYGRIDLNSGPLVNMTEGGDGNSRKQTPEAKAKISKWHKGRPHPKASAETKLKMSMSGKGRVVKEETRKKRSDKQKGIPRAKHKPEVCRRISENSKVVRPVICIETGVRYKSCSAAAREIYGHTKTGPSSVSHVCSGYIKTHKGFSFKYAN